MLCFSDSCNLIQSVKSYQKWDVFLKYFCYYLSRYSILKVTLNKGSLCINQKSLKFDLPLSENGTKNYCYIAGKWTGNRTFHTNQGILCKWCDGKQYRLLLVRESRQYFWLFVWKRPKVLHCFTGDLYCKIERLKKRKAMYFQLKNILKTTVSFSVVFLWLLSIRENYNLVLQSFLLV